MKATPPQRLQPTPRPAEPIQRGRRLDETKPGSGLGHSIIAELAQANHGSFELSRSALGGLQTRLVLPAV